MAADTRALRSRRSLLTAVAAGLGAWATSAFDRIAPVRADDETIQIGHSYDSAIQRTQIANNANNNDTFEAINNHSGAGISGYGFSGRGVRGESGSGVGVFGKKLGNTFGRAGVRGENAAGDGIVGQGSSAGTGVVGDGKFGVLGRSSDAGGFGLWGQHFGTGPGVFGHGVNGIGGQFEGAKAQLKLTPMATAGKPTSGSHTKGEIYMDSKGSLFVCSASGTPGTWRKVTTKLV